MLAKLIRTSSFLGAGFTACALLAACGGGGDGTVFADAVWQMRCPVGLAGCASGGPPHNVFGFDGQEDGPEGDPGAVRTTCTIENIADGRLAISFSVSLGGASLAVRNAVVPEGGGTILGIACRATVIENSVTYSGQCGSSAPSAAQPCQLSNITLDPRAADGPTLQTTLLCQNLTSASDPLRFIRDLERGSPTPRATPAPLRFIHCAGL